MQRTSRIRTILTGFLLLAFVLEGCFEKKTNKPYEAYKYWAGENASTNIKVLHGKYWQSAHFTKEYIVFLELKVSRKWLAEYNKQNHLIVSTDSAEIPDDTPNWFKPWKTMKLYRPIGAASQSEYWEDEKMTIIFLYESHL